MTHDKSADLVSRAADHHIEPITAVEVAALLVTCGMCGAGVLLEYADLDHENGRVDPAQDFRNCPECDHIIDAQAATFSAHLVLRKEGEA